MSKTAPAGASRAAYPVGRATGVCRATGRVLEVGEPYVAALVEVFVAPGQEPALERADYSLEAWNGPQRPPARAVLGSWRAVRQAGSAPPRLLIDDESLLDLFQSTDPFDLTPGDDAQGVRRRAALRLVLALLLVRKRLLVWEGNRGGRLLVRPRGTPPPPEGPAFVEVEDPGLDASLIDELTAQLGVVLATGDAEPRP